MLISVERPCSVFKEKVWVQLRAKCLQLALREALAQLKAFNLLSLTEDEVRISVGTDDHAQIQEQHIGESAVGQLH